MSRFLVALWIVVVALVPMAGAGEATSPYGRWTNSFPTNDTFFPIAVWVQNPRNAARYKAAGINTYVGLWRGPTSSQLEQLERAGMYVVCAQNAYALSNLQNRTIAAWMHGDEPDNAQSLGAGKGYGPPIKPEVIQRDYEKMRAGDPSRPVLLNLGQGVAYDNYIGRGVRRNKPEDYPEYIKGCDIASFDIYPVVHDKPEISGRLEFVARGVERLVKWSGGEKTVWNCIECTHISNPERKPTPSQVRSEVWMALISGSKGLIYFVHQFKPTFNEAALLSDPEMLAAVTKINSEIRELAPVLNSRSITNLATVTGPNASAIGLMVKQKGDSTYLFTVNLRNSPTELAIQLKDVTAGKADVLHEGRHVILNNGTLTETLKPYGVHLYRLQQKQ